MLLLCSICSSSFISKKTKSYQKANFIENLGGTNLGSNRSIQLVKVGNRVLIVGVGEDIQLLTEIEDEAERKQLLVEYNQENGPNHSA